MAQGGNQIVVWKYQTPLKSAWLRTILDGLLTPGLVSPIKYVKGNGFYLTIEKGLSCLVPVPDGNGVVKMTTQANVELVLESDTVAIGVSYASYTDATKFCDIEILNQQQASVYKGIIICTCQCDSSEILSINEMAAQFTSNYYISNGFTVPRIEYLTPRDVNYAPNRFSLSKLGVKVNYFQYDKSLGLGVPDTIAIDVPPYISLGQTEGTFRLCLLKENDSYVFRFIANDNTLPVIRVFGRVTVSVAENGITNYIIDNSYEPLVPALPLNHKTTSTEVGVGDASNYGHLKLTPVVLDSSNDVMDAAVNSSAVRNYLSSRLGVPSTQSLTGIATLDANGKLQPDQAPINALTYEGTWNAKTNTPTLSDGDPDALNGQFYIVNEADPEGSMQFGKEFFVGDWIIYHKPNAQTPGKWQKVANAVRVSSVNNKLGDVVLTGADINVDASSNVTLNSVIADLQNDLSSLSSTVSQNKTSTDNAISGKAPTSHASSATTYGVGTTANYGHLKITDTINDTAASAGTAISPKAVNTVNNSVSALSSTVSNHTGNKGNPHGVTKAQVGLGSVDNTGDSPTPSSGGTTKFTTGGAYTLKTNLEKAISGKAPTSHASSATTYGVGSSSNYGHLKVTDYITETGASSGVAASPKAVYDGLADKLNKSNMYFDSSTATLTIIL